MKTRNSLSMFMLVPFCCFLFLTECDLPVGNNPVGVEKSSFESSKALSLASDASSVAPDVENDSYASGKVPSATSEASSASSYTAVGSAYGYCKYASDFNLLRQHAEQNAIASWEIGTSSSWLNAIGKSTNSSSYFSGSNYYNVFVYATGTPVSNPPATPQNLTATTISDSYVLFSWSASSGAAGYKLYLNGVYQKSTTGTSSTFNGLIPVTTYTISVVAYNNAGTSGTSTISTQTTTTSIPVTISGPTVLTGSASPVWTVTIPGTILGYVIECTVQRGSEPPFSWQTTSPVISFSPGMPGQMLRISVTVTAPGYLPGGASFSCLNAYGM